MSDIVWLASYPKSGNTWFRLLVANLGRDTPVDINALPETSGIASARGWFDAAMLFPSGLLTHEESDRLRPRVYRALAASARPAEPDEQETRFGGAHFIKSHDAYSYTVDGEALLGGAGGAKAAILIVRDPRDIAGSLANHLGRTIDQAIAFMAAPDSSLSGRRDRQQSQLRQQLPTWAGYNRSWLDQGDIPVHHVRYEDLKADTAGVLRAALDFAGIEVSDAACQQAVRFAAFDVLQQQEREHGFREAPRGMTRDGARGGFFRRGVSGGWREELSVGQVARIEADQAVMMARFGYERSGGSERMTG